jgi:hypothetical protein
MIDIDRLLSDREPGRLLTGLLLYREGARSEGLKAFFTSFIFD